MKLAIAVRRTAPASIGSSAQSLLPGSSGPAVRLVRGMSLSSLLDGELLAATANAHDGHLDSLTRRTAKLGDAARAARQPPPCRLIHASSDAFEKLRSDGFVWLRSRRVNLSPQAWSDRATQDLSRRVAHRPVTARVIAAMLQHCATQA